MKKYAKMAIYFQSVIFVGILGVSLCFNPAILHAQEINALDDERTKQLEELGVLLPNPDAIREAAREEFAKPLDQQSTENLENIARDANKYANLISKISDEYNDYIRENSRYDFVIKEVQRAPVVEKYLELDSEFKGIRNMAYLNLGKIALREEKEMKAFLLFNDAYRLSVFSCAEGKEDCVRYEAEQQMKKLLNIEGESYIHWQK
jgi:hypothetical protein